MDLHFNVNLVWSNPSFFYLFTHFVNYNFSLLFSNRYDINFDPRNIACRSRRDVSKALFTHIERYLLLKLL